MKKKILSVLSFVHQAMMDGIGLLALLVELILIFQLLGMKLIAQKYFLGQQEQHEKGMKQLKALIEWIPQEKSDEDPVSQIPPVRDPYVKKS